MDVKICPVSIKKLPSFVKISTMQALETEVWDSIM